jgi:hypothetical protein
MLMTVVVKVLKLVYRVLNELCPVVSSHFSKFKCGRARPSCVHLQDKEVKARAML